MARVKPTKQKTSNGANVGYEAGFRQMADALRKLKYAAVDKYAVLRLMFPVLPATALARLHAFAQGLYGRIDDLENEFRTLAAMRDTVLPKLVSGEVRVTGAGATHA